MDKIKITSKVIEGQEVVIWQASDYKEVTIEGNSVFVSSELIPEFTAHDFIQLTDRAGNYCGLVNISGIASALHTERFEGEMAGMDKADAIYAKHTQKGVMVKS